MSNKNSVRHFADFLDKNRIYRVQNMDNLTRHSFICKIIISILDAVINIDIGWSEIHLKHCIEYSYEYQEKANELDVLYVFRKILTYLIQDQNDYLFKKVLKILTDGDDNND